MKVIKQLWDGVIQKWVLTVIINGDSVEAVSKSLEGAHRVALRMDGYMV